MSMTLPQTSALLLACFLTTSPAMAEVKSTPPEVFTWIPEKVAATRDRALAGDPQLMPAVAKLRKEADAFLTAPPDAVTHKPADHLAPSGDPHDYASIAGYFWPDPKDPKAPWIGIDGKRNVEAIEKFDGPRMARMSRRVTTCAQAYYFTNDARYAKAAADQLRVWFLDPSTRMNPHMNFAQCVPNKSPGQPWGIIDFNLLPEILNSVVLLRGSDAWSDANDAALKAWMREFNDWLWTSKLGIEERNMTNNHGTFYDAMVASAAMYIGDTERAREVLSTVAANRYAVQIEPDGSTPEETKRVNAANYTCWNLKGLADLAILAQKLDPPIDLFHWKTDDGRSLRKSAQWLTPFVEDPSRWAFGSDPFKPTNPMSFFWILTSATNDAEALKVLRMMQASEGAAWEQSRLHLLFPLE